MCNTPWRQQRASTRPGSIGVDQPKQSINNVLAHECLPRSLLNSYVKGEMKQRHQKHSTGLRASRWWRRQSNDASSQWIDASSNIVQHRIPSQWIVLVVEEVVDEAQQCLDAWPCLAEQSLGHGSRELNALE